MKHDIRALALDLDGTLLSPDYSITDRTIAAIASFRDSGRDILIATGRSRRSALPWAQRIGGARAMICQNGGAVYDCPDGQEGELIHEALLPEDLARRIIAFSRGLEIHFHGFCGDNWLYERTFPGKAMYELRSGFLGRPVDFDSLRELRFNKAMFVASPGKELQGAAAAARELFEGEATVLFTGPEYLEILPIGITKATGLELWLSAAGLSLAQVMAIGDAANDREMILAAGCGVAMADAPEDVRAGAAFVTGSVAEDGAATAIERFLAGELQPGPRAP